MTKNTPKMYGINVPVDAEPYCPGTVVYEDGLKAINFVTRDLQDARVVFEHLDSIRISRGEYDPYEIVRQPEDLMLWVYEILPSPWLPERYEYEKTKYGKAYEFSGDVDEMLREFCHYIFMFGDYFIEALATGIWFETFEHKLDVEDRITLAIERNEIEILELSWTHPYRDLERPDQPESFTAHGLVCEIWPNPRPIDEIIKDAKLCSQKLFQFALVFENYPKPSITLSVRVRQGKVQSFLKPNLGRTFAIFDRIATVADVMPHLEQWMHQVSENRKQMGKA